MPAFVLFFFDMLSAKACLPCHATLVEQWSTSRHASARTNPQFTASFAIEPLNWCVDCHAPLPELANEGINCAVCHVREGGAVILASKAPSLAAVAAHPAIRVDARMSQPEYCADCHQFNFPIEKHPVVRLGPHPMQNTFAEFRKSAAAANGATCQSCHLRRGDHSMAGGHDLALLRRTLSVAVRRSGASRALVTLRARGVGHSVPTGDPFRRLVVELCEKADCALPLGQASFGRTFQLDGKLRSDTSIAADAVQRTVEVALVDESPASPLHFRLLYHYTATGAERGLDASDKKVELLRGLGK